MGRETNRNEFTGRGTGRSEPGIRAVIREMENRSSPIFHANLYAVVHYICNPDLVYLVIMTEKWCQDAVQALIDAWHDEPCLFDTKNANYRNKHLRKVAIERVVNKVKISKDNATDDLCMKKFSNMRTDFVKEHKKVLASEKSGAGVEDVYQPSLWYYKELLFLANHVQPRKSTSFGIGKENNSQDNLLDTPMIQENSMVVNKHFDAEGRLNVYIEDIQEDEGEDIQKSVFEPNSSTISAEPPQLQEKVVEKVISPPSTKPIISSPSTKPITSPATLKISKKRKCDDDGTGYVEAMKAVASALNQEEKEVDEIGAFCMHLGKIIRGINNPIRSLRLRMSLTNDAMAAQLEEQQEAQNKSL